MVKPLSSLHPFKTLCNLIRIVLNHCLYVPYLRTFNIRPVSQKDIQLHLPILILEDIVPVTLDRG